MKILITGGAGFIGSNLCEYFAGNGYDVVCLDNLSTGFRHNIEPLLGKPNFRFIEGDIRDLDTCRKAVEGCNVVLHEAALGSVPRSINDPITTNANNITGFLNMLVAARDEKVQRFVYAASSSTYGDSKELPKIEHNIGRPLSPYAITKFVNELYANVFTSLYGIETIGLRYFNVFGRRQDPNGAYAAVIPLWVKALINHESPYINGDGSYSRDFTYIDNIIKMNMLSLSVTNPIALNQIYNTASGEEASINQLSDYIKVFLSEHDSTINDIKPLYGPYRKGDIPHSLASIAKAKQLLGYSPQISFKEGLKCTVEWYLYNHLHEWK